MTFFQARNESEFTFFFSPHAITSLPASEFEIIDTSILQDLISVSRYSCCNNRIGQARKDNKNMERKGMWENFANLVMKR